VEHIGIDPADGKPAVIDPAPPVFQKPAGALIVVLHLQCIARDVEDAVLVAELRSRRGLEGFGLDLPYTPDIPVEKEDVAVKRAGAALGTRRAPEPDIFYDPCEPLQRVLIEAVTFLSQGSDPEWNGG
jgi:hypothetical protein